MQRSRHDSTDDHTVDVVARKAFELEQLMEPDRILVCSAPRIGGDAPACLDLAAVDQREDQVGITDIDREDHARALARSANVLSLAASQLDVAGAHDVERAIFAAKAERAVGFDTVEAAGYCFVSIGVNP